MRVQHNIASMNSYRNYNNNTSMINKNLEKLSSGYKINRAGDNAAGLAISEKMRAQITGLEVAQKNAKDGISLVQTAEGALTEVHSMLNRMYELAEQSANGTYDSSLDRNQLQKEVESLRTEINRIADSANFNGLNLLDGSLSGDSQVNNLAVTESKAVAGIYKSGNMADSAGSLNDADDGLKIEDIGKSMDLTVTWKDADGVKKTTTVSLTFQGKGDGTIDTSTATNNYFTDANGTKYNLDSSGKLSKTQLQNGFMAGLARDEEFSSVFTVEADSDAYKFTAKKEGSAGGTIVGIGTDENFTLAKTAVWNTATNQKIDDKVTVDKAALNSMQKIQVTELKGAVDTDSASEINAKVFEVDGHKFLLTGKTGGLSDTKIAGLDSDITIVKIAAAAPTAGDAATVAAEIQRVTGMETEGFNAAPSHTSDSKIVAGNIVFKNDHLRLDGTGLTLQIGDTAAKYNQLDVAIGDIHTNMLGSDELKLNKIDISKQGGAQEAMDAIKAAINSVSDIRGTLGATQNRLDHTINNLSVMQENIQDAESTIRDTDVADEMMKYTKNSILVQSAQAMLAQANQQPQGVLQLLQ